jgi:hypothetical protein
MVTSDGSKPMLRRIAKPQNAGFQLEPNSFGLAIGLLCGPCRFMFLSSKLILGRIAKPQNGPQIGPDGFGLAVGPCRSMFLGVHSRRVLPPPLFLPALWVKSGFPLIFSPSRTPVPFSCVPSGRSFAHRDFVYFMDKGVSATFAAGGKKYEELQAKEPLFWESLFWVITLIKYSA